MHLSDYMAERGLGDQQVAAELDTDRSTVSRIRRRKTRPTWSLIQKMREWSGGKITADDFEQIEGAEA